MFSNNRRNRQQQEQRQRDDAEEANAMIMVAPAFQVVGRHRVDLYGSEDGKAADQEQHQRDDDDFDPWCERYPTTTITRYASSTPCTSFRSHRFQIVKIEDVKLVAKDEQQRKRQRGLKGMMIFSGLFNSTKRSTDAGTVVNDDLSNTTRTVTREGDIQRFAF